MALPIIGWGIVKPPQTKDIHNASHLHECKNIFTWASWPLKGPAMRKAFPFHEPDDAGDDNADDDDNDDDH